ncbi:hypothetical protein E4U21_007253 [Claviceps maximensis]|nr:hypothetical protein E4U21_007253 [Claviceps maximensis]
MQYVQAVRVPAALLEDPEPHHEKGLGCTGRTTQQYGACDGREFADDAVLVYDIVTPVAEA